MHLRPNRRNKAAFPNNFTSGVVWTLVCNFSIYFSIDSTVFTTVY